MVKPDETTAWKIKVKTRSVWTPQPSSLLAFSLPSPHPLPDPESRIGGSNPPIPSLPSLPVVFTREVSFPLDHDVS